MREGGLRGLQDLVKRAATHERALPEDASWTEGAPAAVAGSARLSQVEQLEIYREQFWGRHLSSLEDDFITARRLLGDDGYRALTRAYLAAHPPASYDLRSLGAKLPGFAAERAPYADDPLLLDALRFDWAFMRAFDASESPPFDPAVLATVPEEAWAGARIALHPSLQLLALGHPLGAMRDAVRNDEPTTRPPPSRWHAAVYRRNEYLKWAELEPLAFALLQRLARGESLGGACEAVAEGDADAVAPKLGAWFQAWTTEGWIARVDV